MCCKFFGCHKVLYAIVNQQETEFILFQQPDCCVNYPWWFHWFTPTMLLVPYFLANQYVLFQLGIVHKLYKTIHCCLNRLYLCQHVIPCVLFLFFHPLGLLTHFSTLPCNLYLIKTITFFKHFFTQWTIIKQISCVNSFYFWYEI